jgi:hypothetical protein
MAHDALEEAASMSSTLSERLAPFLDVLGALLIFGSWFASNALAQQAGGQTAKHQAIIERVRSFRLYEDFASRTRDIQSELTRMSDTSPTIPRWTGMPPTQIRQLNDFVADLEGYAAGSAEPSSPPSPVAKMREGVDGLTADFQSAREEYEGLVRQLESAGDSYSIDVAAEEDRQQRIDALWEEYASAKKTMLQVGDDRLERAAAQAASASDAASRSKRISYVLYALGTLIILYGRARNSLAAKKKAGA